MRYLVVNADELGYGRSVSRGRPSPYCSNRPPAKIERQASEPRVPRKDLVKCVLLCLPGFAALNARYDWFDPPLMYVPPKLERFEVRVG